MTMSIILKIKIVHQDVQIFKGKESSHASLSFKNVMSIKISNKNKTIMDLQQKKRNVCSICA